MGNQEFNHLLLNNADFLKPAAVTLTRDPDVAADLYQETLYKALVNHEKYHAGTNIRAWLFTIMRNIFINNYRRKIKQKIIFDSTGDDVLFNTLKTSGGSDAEGLMEVKYIQKAIHNLPHVFRHPLEMYFEGYKYDDIAGMLKEPLGTIKSRIHFARKLLKSQLERY